MRHSEFWARMEAVLPHGYARVWSAQQELRELDGRTVDQALADGDPPRQIWRAVWQALELPSSER